MSHIFTEIKEKSIDAHIKLKSLTDEIKELEKLQVSCHTELPVIIIHIHSYNLFQNYSFSLIGATDKRLQ